MTSAFAEAFEAGLSDDAKAILAYARKWGTPFTRAEITDIAPGAAWDPYSRWPKTVAKLDPIRELVRAGLIEEYDKQPVRSDRRGVKTYKRWKLTGTDAPPSLRELLEKVIHEAYLSGYEQLPYGIDDDECVEILRRFDRPGAS